MRGFGDKLRDAIKDAGYGSPRQFALKLEIEPRTFTNYTNGRVPDPETLIRICVRLGISPNHLFGFETPNHQQTAAAIAEGLSEERRELWFQNGRMLSEKSPNGRPRDGARRE